MQLLKLVEDSFGFKQEVFYDVNKIHAQPGETVVLNKVFIFKSGG